MEPEHPQPAPHIDRRARESRRADAEPVSSKSADPAELDLADLSDRVAAARARVRLARGPAVELEPDETVARLLFPGERLLATWKGVRLDRREPRNTQAGGLAGDLHVTSARFIFMGRSVLAYPLADVLEVALSDGGLCVSLRDGSGIWLRLAQPRLLRVEIAAARSQARRDMSQRSR